MNNPADILKSIIATYGIEILQQEQRLKAIIADLFAHDKKTAKMLILSVKEQVPNKIIAAKANDSNHDTYLKAIQQHLIEDAFLNQEVSEKILSFWCEALKPKSKNILDIEFVNIPAGTFMMGSPDNEVGRHDDEIQHEVTLSAFRMSKYQITNVQFAAFLNAKGIGSDGKYAAGTYPNEVLIYDSGKINRYDIGTTNRGNWGLNYSNSKWVPVAGYENHPVIKVTWYGADEFAKYVGGTLPTEAQWEYACRAGTSTPFNTGNFLTNLQANYAWTNPYNGGINTETNYPRKTEAVGSYPANAWGLYDMHGNVSERCKEGSYRGGAYGNRAQFCRSACRPNYPPDEVHRTIGFRVVFL